MNSKNISNSGWSTFVRQIRSPYIQDPMIDRLEFDWESNDTLTYGNVTAVNMTLTIVEQITERLQKLIIDDDGSFLYIPFGGSIFLGIVFLVLIATYCRHFSKVGDQRIRWIRHSTNSTCLTGPGTMTVICNNWVYLCRQHGHFGIVPKRESGLVTSQHIRKCHIKANKRRRGIDLSVEDVTIEQSNASLADGLPSDAEQGNSDLPSSNLPMRKAGSGCFPWTSYPTPAGLVSYREFGEPAPNSPRCRPETPAGQYYCVSGRHTPADEQIEFWDYTPELERKAAAEALNAMSQGGPGGSAGTTTTRITNVSFATTVITNPPSSPSSPSILPRPSLTTPNLSVLGRATTSITPQQNYQRRQSKSRRPSSMKQQPSITDEEMDPRWKEVMAAITTAKPTLPHSKPSSERFETVSGTDTPRERTGSTGSQKDKEALEMHKIRSYSPATQRKRELAAQSAATSGPSRPISRNVAGYDDEVSTRRTAGGPGGILAITKIGREIREKQQRYN